MTMTDRAWKAAMVQAILNVVERINERSGKAPSKDVQVKTASKLGIAPPVTSTWLGPCQLRYVDGDHDRYMVVLKMHTTNVDSDIIDAECSCPASTTCWHLLAVLAREEHDGRHLLT